MGYRYVWEPCIRCPLKVFFLNWRHIFVLRRRFSFEVSECHLFGSCSRWLWMCVCVWVLVCVCTCTGLVRYLICICPQYLEPKCTLLFLRHPRDFELFLSLILFPTFMSVCLLNVFARTSFAVGLEGKRIRILLGGWLEWGGWWDGISCRL